MWAKGRRCRAGWRIVAGVNHEATQLTALLGVVAVVVVLAAVAALTKAPAHLALGALVLASAAYAVRRTSKNRR